MEKLGEELAASVTGVATAAGAWAEVPEASDKSVAKEGAWLDICCANCCPIEDMEFISLMMVVSGANETPVGANEVIFVHPPCFEATSCWPLRRSLFVPDVQTLRYRSHEPDYEGDRRTLTRSW